MFLCLIILAGTLMTIACGGLSVVAATWFEARARGVSWYFMLCWLRDDCNGCTPRPHYLPPRAVKA